MQGMDLNSFATGGQCHTCLKEKPAKSCTAECLAKHEGNHFIRSNVIEIIHPPTSDKSNYVLTSVIERSKFSKLYKIKQCSDVFDRFLEFLAWYE